MAKLLDFYKGMDLSFLPEFEDKGMILRDRDGAPTDPLALAKKYGVNAVRLRLWNDPAAVPEAGGYCDFTHTLAMAKRIKAAGLNFLLDFHYSDYWADPGQQRKPHSWRALHGKALEQAVYNFTRETLLALAAAGTAPDMVQIGNEIRSGMLFPDGELPRYAALAGLVNAGIAAAKSLGGSTPAVMIHLDQGGRYCYLKDWFNHLFDAGLADFDVIGLSYYPFWHGSYADLKQTMEKLAADYGKPLIVAETAHAWRKSAHGFMDEQQEQIAGIPATPEGQRKVLELVANITAALPGQLGRGFYYWEPFCLPLPGEGGWAENMGLLGPDGRVMEGIYAFGFTPAAARPGAIAKVYPPSPLCLSPGGPVPSLPQTAALLYYDGALKSCPIHWPAEATGGDWCAQKGIHRFTGDCCGQPVPLTLLVEEQSTGHNLLADPNWQNGLACWQLAADAWATAQVVPAATDNFPAPPENLLEIESERNFSLTLSQTVAVPAGRYRFTAEFRGADTTNVDIRLCLGDDACQTETVIHPTEHEWRRFDAVYACNAPAQLRAALVIHSPPIKGLLQHCTLRRLTADEPTALEGTHHV